MNDELRAAAHSAIQFQFHSSLPNGKNGLKWMLTGRAAPREQSNQIKLSFNLICCCSRGGSVIWEWRLVWCFLSLGGLWALAAPRAPPKREDKHNKPTGMNQWSWKAKEREWREWSKVKGKSIMKSIYWWNGWLPLLSLLLNERNGAPSCPLQRGKATQRKQINQTNWLSCCCLRR